MSKRVLKPIDSTFITKTWIISTKLLLGYLAGSIYVKNLDIFISVSKKNLIDLLKIVKDNGTCQFKQLTDITVYDNPGSISRFTLIYQLLSLYNNQRIYVLVKSDELTPIQSVSNLFLSATWTEREVWDLFGIFFSGHLDLRRILTDYNFQGHPLRKDFPLSGYIDLFYDDSKKHIVYAPIELTQEYRNFNFKSPWL